MTTLPEEWLERKPAHWSWRKLNRVAQLGTGHTPDRTNPEYWLDCDIPWVTAADLSSRPSAFEPLTQTQQHVSKLGLQNSAAVEHQSGTVMFCRTASVGLFCIIGVPMATTQAFVTWTAGETLDSRYLLYVIAAMGPEFDRLAYGSTHLTIYMPDLEALEIPVPPLDEQRRVVDFLDDQVTRIDGAISARADQLALIEARRSESIRLGVAGALDGPTVKTSLPWSPERAPDAEARPLARMVSLQRGVDLTADERTEGPFSVVTSGGVVGTHQRAIVPNSGVVVGRYGSGGSVYWVEGPHWPHNTTLYVRDYQGNVPRWVYYLLSAFPYEALQARAAVPGINRNDMAGQLMPWLPVPRQQESVTKLDEVLRDLDSLSALAESSSRTLEERKRALITAAVTGEFDVSTAGARAASAVLE